MELGSGSRIPDVERIVVLRANAIGDFLFTLPALEALRAAYPDAQITLLALPWHAAFLRDRPSPVDRVIAIPPCRGVGEPEDYVNDDALLEEFFARMRSEHFDLAVQLHGGGRYSNPFVRQLGARITAGLKAPEAEPLDRWMPYVFYQKEIFRFLEAVALAGASPVSLEPRVTVTAADLSESHEVVPDDDPRPLVALNPGANDPRRRWPPEKFAEVGDALAARGVRVVITGSGNDDRALAASILGTMQANAIDSSGALSLGGLAGLFARCRLVISNDTGPLHLAAAVGTATVGIYWSLNLVTAGGNVRTRHRPVTSWKVTCPECGANRVVSPCAHLVSLVADVPVDEVLAQALDLL